MIRPSLILSVLLATVFWGCTVGPDFVAPAPPETGRYLPAGESAHLTAGGGEPAQHLLKKHALQADWWQMFHSQALNGVVHEALAGNPSLDAASASLEHAREVVSQARGSYFPQVDLAAGAERQRGPAFALGLLPSTSQTGLPLFNLYTIGPSINFSPDVFGLTARQVEQQVALAEKQGYLLAATQLTLTGNVVTQSLSIAATRQQIHAMREIIASDEKNLALTHERYDSGKIAMSDILAAESQLNTDRALLPPLEQQLTVAQDTLAVLVGKAPSEWTAPHFDMAEFTLPPDLPLSLPSDLVRQRPDILAAEAQLHASSAYIGVATAQMYPSFPLSASIDAAALSSTTLVNNPSVVWSLSGGLLVPIFHGGALEAQKRAAEADFHAALALYRQTVLQALEQVADLIKALEHDAQLVTAEGETLNDATQALDIQRVRYAAGRSDMLALLDAERKTRQALLGATHARVQRMLDSAQLMVALGGGWWQGAPAPCAPCTAPSTGTHGERK